MKDSAEIYKILKTRLALWKTYVLIQSPTIPVPLTFYKGLSRFWETV